MSKFKVKGLKLSFQSDIIRFSSYHSREILNDETLSFEPSTFNLFFPIRRVKDSFFIYPLISVRAEEIALRLN